LSELRAVKLQVSDTSGHSKRSDRPNVKILTTVIRAQDGTVEFLTQLEYTILAIIVNFKGNAC